MTWNVNGLRSALKKGLPEVVQEVRPQVVLLQEVRAFPEDLPAPWANPPRWHVVWNPAEKPGYSGTAIWSRSPIEVLETGLGGPDQEGRVIVARTGGVVVGCLYLPSGSSSEARQKVKDQMLEEFTAWAEPWRKKPNRSAWQETSTSPPPNVTSSTGRATKRQVVFYPMNALGSPTCCNADGTTPCVIKQVNATVRTPGGRIVDKLVRWIGDGGSITGSSTTQPSASVLAPPSTENTVSVCRTTPP